MSSFYDYDRFRGFLFELESALCSVAAKDCEGLQKDCQLSAVIFNFLRATSLFRAALSLLESGLMDASDGVRRACWEALMLGYELRLKESQSHAARWHYEKNKHSDIDLSAIKSFEKSNGLPSSKYGSDYGGLSEVTHPTKAAAENSFVTVTALHGNPASKANLEMARQVMIHEDAPGIMYFLIWAIVVKSVDMIDLGIVPDSIPKAWGFYHDYENQETT
jgi:hypothetical protein